MQKNTIEYIYKFLHLPLNASSPHQAGQKASKILEDARNDILNSLNIDKDNFELIFTSSATEANNMMIQSFNHIDIFSCATEHSSIVNPKLKTKKINIEKNGIIDLTHLNKICKIENEKIISIGYANGVTGIIQPMKKIIDTCKQNKSNIIHSDCTQALGKTHMKLENIDIITLSGHKIGAPAGIGCCIARKNILSPFIHGGGQEFGLRGGTENIIGAIALAYAIKSRNIQEYIDHTKYLQAQLESFLSKYKHIQILGKDVDRISNTTYFISKTIPNDEILIHLDLNNINVSTGSACLGGFNNLSHVIKEMKFSKSGIRISFGLSNTRLEVEKLCNVLSDIF